MTDAGNNASTAILIVEDEGLIAFDMEACLLEAGYSIAGIAANVDEAVAIIERLSVHAAIMDANLAGQSSEPIARRLREIDVPFLIVSGYTRGQLADWIADTPLVTKPFAPAALVAKVAKILNDIRDPVPDPRLKGS